MLYRIMNTNLPEKGLPYMSLTNANCHILTLVNN